MTEDTTTADQTARHHDIIIIVNTERKPVASDVVSYDEVVALAYPTPPTPDTIFSVTYRNAVESRDGSLVAGQTVTVRPEGTIFNVKATGRS